MQVDMNTKNIVNNYLNDLRRMLNKNAKIVLSNRDKNILFCENNNIKYNDIKYILSQLKIQDFCKILNNKSINTNERLFLFAPYVKIRKTEYQQMYIKINKIESKNVIILISFHRSKYFLRTMFKGRVKYNG